MGLRHAAASLGVSPSIWSAWENDSEPIAPIRFGGIDRALGADGGLASLLHATTTESAFPARSRWSLHRTGPSRRWWLYVRRDDVARPASSGASTLVDVEWGPVQAVGLPLGPNGTIVLVPVSVANPAVEVSFRDGRGWVDAGTGQVPRELGLDVIHGVKHIVAPTVDLATQVVARWIRQLGGGGREWDEFVLRFFGGAPFVAEALATADAPTPPQINRDLRTASATSFRRPVGADYLRARQGRRRSRAAVAEVVTALEPTHPVSEDQVRRLEASTELGSGPVVTLLRARLDQVYDADGHLGDGALDSERVPTETIAAGHGPVQHRIRFPDWWVGPVWFRIDAAPGRAFECNIHWGLWTRSLLVESGQKLWARRPQPGYADPVITVPPMAQVSAGLGRMDGAVDINRHWDVHGDRARRRLLREYVPLFLSTFGKSPDEAARAIRRYARPGRVRRDRGDPRL